MSGELREVEFEPIEEKWNEYEILDENVYVRLRGRIILMRLLKTSSLKPQYQMKFHKVFVVSSPRKGPPMKLLPPSEIQRLEKYPVEIISSREPWNIYKITETGELFRVKLIVTDIYRVKNLYDPEGQPYYIIQSGPLVTRGKGKLTPP